MDFIFFLFSVPLDYNSEMNIALLISVSEIRKIRTKVTETISRINDIIELNVLSFL